MDLRWVEDFLCLARLRSFSRAAEARYVTQSAFSRRIRSLENWFGAPLIDRNMYPVTLTDAGENFLHTASEIARQIYEARADAAQTWGKTERTVTFAAQHSLSLDFFAQWIEAVEVRIGALDVRLIADNYYNAVQSLREGASDFLICFTHPEIIALPYFESLVLGRERLIPVSAVTPGTRRARWRLSTDAAKPTPYLAYGAHTFLGKVVRLILEREPCALRPCFENAFGESLKSMALRGRGVAWLPENIVAAEIDAGKLRRIGGARRHEMLDVCLFRRYGDNVPLVDVLWTEAGRKINR